MSAEVDLERKLRLEDQLEAEISEYNEEIAAAVLAALLAGGLPTTKDRDKDLSDILNNHYSRAADDFFGDIADNLPSDVAMTRDERNKIVLLLDQYFSDKAKEQAEIINRNTDKDIIESISQATIEAEEEGLSGGAIATLTTAFLLAKLNGRTQGITTSETQMSAETTKATEAEILSGNHPTITGGDPRKSQGVKRWETVGDEKVRDAHVAADFQEVPINQPFIVGGEKLMFPRDQSMGASIWNWINCRCSASYNIEDIVNIRLGLMKIRGT